MTVHQIPVSAAVRRLARIAELIKPCPPPHMAAEYDLCPCGKGSTWPCDTTRAAWLASGQDPATCIAEACRQADQRQQIELISLEEIYDYGITCPSCRDAAHVIEIRNHVFECGDCGATWSA
jgi:hypothetical protein